MAGEQLTVGQEIEPLPKYWYEVTRPPSQGDWPEGIKNQWVGVRIPVKNQALVFPPEDTRVNDPGGLVRLRKEGLAGVDVNDAVSALRLAGRTEAADFWVSTAKSLGWEGDKFLYFRLDEGLLIDSTTEQLLAVADISYAVDENTNRRSLADLG